MGAAVVGAVFNATMNAEFGGDVADLAEKAWFPTLDEDTKDNGKNVVSEVGAGIVNGMDAVSDTVSSARDSVLSATKDVPVVGALTQGVASVGNVVGGVWTELTKGVDSANELVNKAGGLVTGAAQTHSERTQAHRDGTEMSDEEKSELPLDQRIAEDGVVSGLIGFGFDRVSDGLDSVLGTSDSKETTTDASTGTTKQASSDTSLGA